MKRAFIELTFNVCDDFQIGNCKMCPLNGESYYENRYVEVNTFCKLGLPGNLCPIKMEVLNDEVHK